MPKKGMRCVFFKAASKEPAATTTTAATEQHSSSRTFTDSFMEEKIAAAEGFIGKWDADASSFASVTSLFYDNRGEALEYLKSVRELHSAMHFFVAQEDSSSHMHALLRAQKLMQTSMKRLEKEFYQILASNRDHLDPESVSTRSSSTTVITSARSSVSDLDDQLCASDDDELRAAGDSISEVERVSALAMADLKAIADCMIATGYGKECFSIYRTIRKSIIDEGLYNLGVEKLSPSQMARMDWDVLALKIKSWLNAVKVAVKTLFYGERLLCDHVFSASASIQESCFAAIAADGATTLLGFPQLVARFKKSPEKMFSTLDLYEAIAHLFPDIESIFQYDSTQAVRQQAVESLVRLGDSVRAMLLDFEALIQKDSSKSPVSGGGVHPLTRYVMNYLGFLSDYTGLLSDIVGDLPAKSTAQLPESYLPNPSSSDGAPASPIAVRMAWLVLVLLCRLDVKAELYKDVSLSYLFLANNLQYVIKKVRSSNLRHLLGDHWVSTQAPKVNQYLANYERMGWSKVFESLTVKAAAAAAPETETTISREEAKRLFKNFNAAFEEACRKQASWVVHDQKLREEIKASVARKLGPVYRDIYEKYSSVFRDEMGVESIVRFSPDDFENYLSDLFRGAAGVSGNSASSSPSMSTPSRWRRLSGNIF